MHESLRKTLGLISAELERQDAKWGQQSHGPERWLVILGEEFGEACRAALELRPPPEEERAFSAKLLDRWDTHYRAELIQVAAVAIAAIECYDRLLDGHTHEETP